MGKFIFWALIIGAGIWAYYNLDFTQIMPNTVNSVSKEKTINKVQQTRERQHDLEKEAIEEY
ncbi:MAG: hypothetical protein LBK53_07485 [Heliobacteriaceae bacterium]|jgi:heme exporter protein D|nr:hypothetical protein [Heliobacteriaceae bacterium]